MCRTPGSLLAQAVGTAYFGFKSQQNVSIIQTTKQFKIAETELKLLCRALTGYRKMLLSCMKELTPYSAVPTQEFLTACSALGAYVLKHSPKDEVA